MQLTAERIRHYRQCKGFSQEDVALRANLNVAYLGQVERGLKCPTVDTLFKIATALGVPTPALVDFSLGNITDYDHTDEAKRLISSVPPQKKDEFIAIMQMIAKLL